MFLGICAGCGCRIFDDYIEEFDEYFCNHEIQTTLEGKEKIAGNEDNNQEGSQGGR